LTRVVRKHVNWWVVVFLPIFLRALIPVGFMPMVGPGHSVRLVLCDSYAPVPHAMSTSMSMPADMPADMPMHAAMGASHSHGSSPIHEDHGTCPYGSGPALGALPTLAVLPLLLIQRSLEPAVAAPQVAYFKVSPRAQSPRGPPA
jgi:hypothetical protein